MKLYCPQCGTEMKRPEKPVQWDNSRTCEKGHKFDVFIVANFLTVKGYLNN